MTLDELRRVHSNFKDDNPLLFLSLGLASSFAKLDRILKQHATDGLVGDDASDPIESAGIDFVLGLIAFQKRFEAQIAASSSSKDTLQRRTSTRGEDEEVVERTQSLWR
jgi:hypothetical protein